MNRRLTTAVSRQSAFTMIEIAICLAIIGIGLVGIIGVLPLGMNTQRDNREETVINQDASMLLEVIRNGARGADDLTNYVYAITNYQSFYNPDLKSTTTFGYGANYLTNGANIVGLLSTPEFVDKTVEALPIPNVVNGGYSNHVVAYVRSLSGLATEKPPQNNDIMVGDAFSYRVFCVNAPVAMDTNTFNTTYNKQVWFNQRELRLTFLWPQLPNGSVGNGHQTFRATLDGQLAPGYFLNNQGFYFYQSQSFVLNTNAP